MKWSANAIRVLGTLRLVM